MKEIIFGTKNPAKIAQVQGALNSLKIVVKGIGDIKNLPEVEEDGKTAQENARKKALAYAKAIGKPVFSMDNALYFDNFPKEKQPGINVRRIPGSDTRPSDQEMLDYYREIFKEHNNRLTGHWDFAVAVAYPDGKIVEDVIKSPKRYFTSKMSDKTIKGYPLESMQIDIESGKYISEMTKDEQANFWQKAIGSQLQQFFEKIEL